MSMPTPFLITGHLISCFPLSTDHSFVWKSMSNISRSSHLDIIRSFGTHYVWRIVQYHTSCLIFLDKVSKDDGTCGCLWGCISFGSRVKQHRLFVRKQRFSIVVGMALDEGIIAAKVIEGSFNRECFIELLGHIM